jgi:DNA-binding transcriptional ArsR family regulator
MVNDVFGALAHPVRRGIVERLAHGPATVGAATRGFGVSKPAITKHLKVLEHGGVVVRTVEGRTHLLGLNTEALRESAAWLDRQRAAWDRLFDAVEDQLRAQSDRGGDRP